MQSEHLTSATLQNGELISMGILEVTSIPHISVVDSSRGDPALIIDNYKGEFQSLLGEIYQIYKASHCQQEFSLELLWLTQAVANQPYKARIRLFIICRSISRSKSQADNVALTVLSLLENTLNFQKYEFSPIKYSELNLCVSRIDDSRICAVVKDETAENLQNSLFPYCYSYSRFPVSHNDMSRIVSSLIANPDCAVSFQLIPTALSAGEVSELDRVTQALDTLQKGVMNQGIGNVSFTLAERHAETYKYYSYNKTAPLFSFNILVYGANAAATGISSSIFGQLSAGSEQSANLKLVDLKAADVQKERNFYPLPWAVNELLLSRGRNAGLWASNVFSRALFRLPYVISAEEASEFYRLPVGNDRISAGLPINESKKDSKNYAADIINGGNITVGKLRASTHGDTIGFSLNDLAKHMLVVGTPGSGKTTFSVSMLDRLWKEHNIPFLVLEPAKNEYRALIQSIPELQVFTPGKNLVSPFVFNPFIPPKNVKLETYKSTLKTAFSAAVSMSTPLDKIFEESINNCYSDFRWLDTYTADDGGESFNIADFIKCFKKTFGEIGYTGDAKNVGLAGVVRLNSLANLFDNYFSIPLEDLLLKPTVIELAAIENTDQKALIIALVLLSALAYVNANYVGEGGLKNVILIEEAHVLLEPRSGGGLTDADPSAVAQGLIKRMLAEIRSYGVGLIIADQSPRKVSSDVVALTDMKMVFRLVESEDKKIIADSTNMAEAQVQRLSKLKPGEAFLFFNKLDEPEEVSTPDYRLENKISISLSDRSIRDLSTYWQKNGENLRPYPQCRLCSSCQETCDYSRRILAREIARRIFIKYFKPSTKDFDVLRQVFRKISKLITAELNTEPFTSELLSCVKVHLWRRIRYGTQLNISDALIENSIKR